MTVNRLKTSEDSPAGRSTPLWLAVAIVLAAIVIALGPIALGGFSYWDDEDTISLNPGFNPPTWASLADRWTRSHLHIYIPVTHTVWHVLAMVAAKPQAGEVGNVIALPFKLTNLGTHAIASVLVLMILRRLVGKGWPAIAGAVAFAVHPVQVEAVAWASGLKDVLFGMFSAACVLAYIGGKQDRLRPRGRNVAIALVMLVLAGLSKPTAMVVPAMLLVLDVFPLRRPMAQSIARLIPFGVVAVVFAALAMRIQSPPPSEVQTAFGWRPLVAADSIAFYLGKLIVPVGLAYDYGRPAKVVIAAMCDQPWRAAICVIVALATLAFVAIRRKRSPLVVAGILLALIAIAPVLGMTYFDFSHYSVVADHYLYLPMMGVAIVIAAALDRVRRARAMVFGAIIVIAIAWMTLSFCQSLTWRNAKLVSEQTLRVNDRSYASLSNLALWELRAGHVDQAEAYARRAVNLAVDDPQSAFVMANVLQERGDDRAAADWVRRAVRLSPYSAPFHYRLATLLGKLGDVSEALDELDQTLALDHKYPGAEEKATQLRAFIRQQSRATMPTSAPATTAPGGR